MKLLIVSHTAHYKNNKQLVGWGATVREIDHLASIFEKVIHIAFLHSDYPPKSSLPYRKKNIDPRLVPPSGGDSFKGKLSFLYHLPKYIFVILKSIKEVDAVHVRCPANISLLTIVLLWFLSKPKIRWIKYAGNWNFNGGESWAYRFQRWWLQKNLSRGVITVNGCWPEQPKHIKSFLNPCLTDEELSEGERVAQFKRLTTPIQIIFVGRLETEKGSEHCIDILKNLIDKGVTAYLDMVGDGKERLAFEDKVRAQNLCEYVRFQGWLSREEVVLLYKKAHFILLPSYGEGWPKVLSEAMAYGVIPLASNVSSIPYYFEKYNLDKTFKANDIQGFSNAIIEYSKNPNSWIEKVSYVVKASKDFSYSGYLKEVKKILEFSKDESACVNT